MVAPRPRRRLVDGVRAHRLPLQLASVIAVAILFGTIAIAAGLLEFAAASASAGGWKLLRYVLGVIFIATGIVALFTPGGTFVALAAIVSFFFVFAWSFDIVAAFASRSENPGWWPETVRDRRTEDWASGIRGGPWRHGAQTSVFRCLWRRKPCKA